MYRLLKLISFLIISFIFLSCDNPLENRVEELENELENQKLEQDNQNSIINSLISQLLSQQTIIDSLNNVQLEYSDSIYMKLLEYSDSINMEGNNYTDSVHIEQLKELDSLNNNLTSYIDDLISNQNQMIELLISTQPETNNDYLRIDSLQICWGSGRTNNSGVTLEYPASFLEPPRIFMDLIVGQNALGVNEITTTSARFYINWENYWNFSYFALGKWK